MLSTHRRPKNPEAAVAEKALLGGGGSGWTPARGGR